MAAMGYGAYWWFTSEDDPGPTAPEVAQSDVTPQPAQVEAAPAAPPQPSPEEIAQKEKDLRYAHNCLSVWDGSHGAFVRLVEAQLNDPDSFDHVETTTWPRRDDGRNQIVMTFRAKNGFGGVVTGKAVGTVTGSDCASAKLDDIQQ